VKRPYLTTERIGVYVCNLWQSICLPWLFAFSHLACSNLLFLSSIICTNVFSFLHGTPHLSTSWLFNQSPQGRHLPPPVLLFTVMNDPMAASLSWSLSQALAVLLHTTFLGLHHFSNPYSTFHIPGSAQGPEKSPKWSLSCIPLSLPSPPWQSLAQCLLSFT
jgi:hypothetical protein